MSIDRNDLHGASSPRPLTARSVIASTLLGVDPPVLPAAALVRSGSLFGFTEGATRTALSRMAASGEVVADDGRYRLTGPLLDRHRRQMAARTPVHAGWSGTWELAIVTSDRRSAVDRAAMRRAGRALKLFEVREGCWARPDNLSADRSPDALAVLAQQCTLIRDAVPESSDRFVESMGLAEWASEARRLVAAMDQEQDALDRRSTGHLRTTFVLDAEVLRHLVADPEPPAPLQPADWPGADLRHHFDRFDDAFKATWRAWHRAARDEM